MFTQNIHGSLSTLARFGLVIAAVLALGLTPMLTAREGGGDEVSTYTGDPITLSLKDADIRDVLSTFSRLTEIEILTEPSVTGIATIELVDTPWDEALERILRENDLVSSIEGGRIIVRKADREAIKISHQEPRIEGTFLDGPLYRFVVGSDVTEPKKTGGPSPRYPKEARKEGLSGVVALDCIVGPEGKIHEIEVVRSPDQRLTDAASDAVRQWIFEPSTLDGEPVAVRYTLTVKFNLQ